MIIHGTAHFVSIQTAYRYYSDYDFSKADVRRKVAEGEIHIGKPTLDQGQRLTVIDSGTRYGIIEGDSPKPKAAGITDEFRAAREYAKTFPKT